ncbi:MAG: zinc ribbon domain-containing protein [Clostridia bacterium]|nr:zinc ribbon domain-containing protein [Clostridia bacterium]
MNCPNCNQPVAAGVRFCMNCGTDVTAAASAPAANKAPAFDFSKIKSTIQNIPRKYLAFGGIGVVAIIAIILVFALIIPALSGPAAYALYIKDKELNMAKLPGTKSWQVTEDLADGDISETSLAGSVQVLVSEDGKRIFYPDGIDSSDGFDLYYKSTSDKKGAGTKIASGVDGYMITPNGKTVIYLSDGTYYTHNLKEKTKIVSDAESFYCSTDAKKFYWTDEDGDLYYKNGKNDKVKISSEISYVEAINDKFTTIHYVKDEALYVSKNGKDAEKIASDIESVYAVYDDGTAYFTVAGESDVSTYWDYVEDYNAKNDKALLEDGEPDWDDEDYDAYWEASRREEVRNELKEMELETNVSTLCYYNGKEVKNLTTEFVDYEDYSSDKAVFIYSTQVVEELNTIDLADYDFSNYVSPYDLRDEILGISEDADEDEDEDEESDEPETTMYVAVKDKTSQIDQESAFSFVINENADTVLFFDEIDKEDPVATLYKMAISGGKAKKPEKVDEEVYVGRSAFFLGKKIVYLKDYDEEKGEAELYVDKKSIASEVHTDEYGSYIRWDSENGNIFFFTEWDSEDGYGTLNVYNGKKVNKIHEEVVAGYKINEKGDVLFLYDVSEKHHTGELWYYNGKAKKLDDDVVGIVDYIRITKELWKEMY